MHKESVSNGLEEVDKEKLQMAVVTQLAKTQKEIMPGKILAEAKNTHLFESGNKERLVLTGMKTAEQ